MSYIPIGNLNAVTTTKNFVVYSGRIKINEGSVLNSATLQTFVNPSLYQSVTIPVSSTYANPASNPRFREGEYVVIGSRVGLFQTPSSITGVTINCRIRSMGSYIAGTSLSGNYFLTNPGVSSLVKTATTINSLGNVANGSTMNWTVDSFSGIPTNDSVAIGTHAGTFLINSVDSIGNTITIKKIAEGDVPAGQTIPIGVKISSGILLGVTRNHSKTSQFIPVESYCGVYYKDPLNTSNNTPVIGIGWGANSDSGRDPFSESFGIGSGSGNVIGASGTSVGKYRPITISNYNDEQRLGVPAGHALMCNVRTKTSLNYDYILSIAVKGFYTE